MFNLCLFALNEAMAFFTLIVVFPGFLPPKDRFEAVRCCLILIPVSLVWPIFLAVFPIAYLLLWWSGGLEGFNPYFHEWPFR